MASFDPSTRPRYTASEIQQYYQRIDLPASCRELVISDIANTQDGLDFLTVLQKYHLAAIPFENLELHYSPHHTISLDPRHLFHKIVGRNAGRGGYCMEVNCLFGTILKSLGFDTMPVGAKVNDAAQPRASKRDWPGPQYDGWSAIYSVTMMKMSNR